MYLWCTLKEVTAHSESIGRSEIVNMYTSQGIYISLVRATAQDYAQIFSITELVLFLTDKIAMTWTSATKRLTHTQGVWCT